MTEEVKKVLLEEFLPQMTCELLLHLNFFNQGFGTPLDY